MFLSTVVLRAESSCYIVSTVFCLTASNAMFVFAFTWLWPRYLMVTDDECLAKTWMLPDSKPEAPRDRMPPILRLCPPSAEAPLGMVA